MSTADASPGGAQVTTIDVAVPAVAAWSYPVVIGTGLAQAVREASGVGDLAGLRPVVLTDAWCRDRAARLVADAFAGHGRPVDVLALPLGEQHKTRATKEALEDEMISRRFGRDTLVIAVGGGVVTDMAGFLAATYARGVPYLSMPTTLLAAADACIGGKTGLDTPAATNLIGALHHPRGVFIDLDTWRTLPDAQVRAGLAETVKHACLADGEFFDVLEHAFMHERRAVGELVGDLALCAHIARRNCEIKRAVVQEDPGETDARMALNLGHTFGRALEAVLGFTMSHGEAVAVGLALQARWATERGSLTQGECDRVIGLLEGIGLPVELPAALDYEVLLDKMHLDKKTRGGTVNFVFQDGIGAIQRTPEGRVGTTVSDEEIRRFLWHP
jgi:3-dehydroquinate synthase